MYLMQKLLRQTTLSLEIPARQAQPPPEILQYLQDNTDYRKIERPQAPSTHPLSLHLAP